MIKLTFILLIIGIICCLIILLYQSFLEPTSRAKSEKQKKTHKGSPNFTNTQAITDHIKNNYNQIEKIKRQGRHRSKRDNQLLKEIAMTILRHNIITKELNCNQLFAALFCVNYTWKNSKGENKNKLRDLKNYLQRVIILYHDNEINKTKINTGKFAGCWEIKKGPWSTHVPRHVFENGHLDRAGKKNPRL